jgi:catechol 2,3-dioxygenase-like lactoylglutathione lyase family enzyme
MDQHLHIVTLGVQDLKTSFAFYKKTLGWKPSSNSNDDIAFFRQAELSLASIRARNWRRMRWSRQTEASFQESHWHITRAVKRKLTRSSAA